MSSRDLATALFVLLGAGCEDVRPATRPTPLFPVELPPAPTPLRECRFEPVTRASGAAEPAKSGADMCFTAGTEPEPWWMRYRADAAPTPMTVAADAAPPPPPPACPPDMLLVDGEYCPDVRQRCLRYLDDGVPGGFLSHHRCAEFDKSPQCLASRQHRRFCIDRDEYVPPGADKPLVDQSWTMAKDLCESQGKRLCFESEWQFACEGEALWPYPYGFTRNAKLCNIACCKGPVKRFLDFTFNINIICSGSSVHSLCPSFLAENPADNICSYTPVWYVNQERIIKL